MCGICGLVSSRPLTQQDQASVRAANAALFHRGPDGDGYYSDSQVLLAMRRLSIIDLTGGWQPLYNEDKSIALVANGEVYNFIELRKELEGRGHTFRTKSDCETIAHLYEERGLDFVHALRGMYAIALFDTRKRRVVIVRDRMGEKPVYLMERNNQVWFSSEMKSILATGQIPFELEPTAIADYFHYQYVPEPRTAVKGVRKLPAGHMLVIDLDPWRVEQKCYWRLEDAPPLEGNSKELIREQLEEIGKLIIRSDVPVGVALSAGLDSSTVAALAAKNSPSQMHALSVGYAGRPHMDERMRAKALADSLGMVFHDVEIQPEDVVRDFSTRVFMRDDPIADISGHGYYALARLTRENNIPVLLQGHGIDELFWGYDWVRSAAHVSRLKAGQATQHTNRLTALFRKLLPAGYKRRDLRRWAVYVGGLLTGWRKINPCRGAPADRVPFYDMAEEYEMGHWVIPRITTPEFQERVAGHDTAWPFTIPQPWGDIGVLITKLICDTYLLENGMAQGDRLSMAWSVELRLPFVDYKLAETAIGLRKASPDDGLAHKARFREVIKDILPEWVLNRPKTGFTPPMRDWMGALNEPYGATLPEGYLVEEGILTPEGARRMIKPHSRVTAWPTTLYKTLVLEWWCRRMAAQCAYGAKPEVAAAPVVATSPV